MKREKRGNIIGGTFSVNLMFLDELTFDFNLDQNSSKPKLG